MKNRKFAQILLVGLLVCVPIKQGYSQLVIAQVIKAGIKRVIKAVDLRVQRLQNQTIWLQNAQKELENKLSKLRLQEITQWSDRQRQLYSEYYNELTKVKTVIRYYRRITEMAALQKSILQEYQRAWRNFSSDPLFSVADKAHIKQVHQGILQDCMENVDMLTLVIQSFTTQMSDAERLSLIEQMRERMETNYFDMKVFNQQTNILRLNRQKNVLDDQHLRSIYGLN